MIDRTPKLQKIGAAHAKQKYRDLQIKCHKYVYEQGIDQQDISG